MFTNAPLQRLGHNWAAELEAFHIGAIRDLVEALKRIGTEQFPVLEVLADVVVVGLKVEASVALHAHIQFCGECRLLQGSH